MFITPFEEVLVFGPFGTLSRVAGMGAVVAALLALGAGRPLRRPGPQIYLLSVFVFWAVFAGLRSTSPDEAGRTMISLMQGLAFAMMLWQFVDSPRARHVILAAFVCGALVPAVFLVMTAVGGQDIQRAAVFGENANRSAALLAMAIPAGLFLITSGVRASRILAAVAIPLFIAGLLATGSRTGFLAMIASGVVFVAWRPRSWRWPAAGIGVVLGAAVAWTWLAPDSMSGRFRQIPQVVHQESGTMGYRVRVWEAGIASLKENPLTGAGLATYRSIAAERTGLYHVAHNAFLSILAEQGLIGLGLFLSAIAAGLYGVRQIPPEEQRVLLAVSCAWLVASMALPTGVWKETWWVLGMLASAPHDV